MTDAREVIANHLIKRYGNAAGAIDMRAEADAIIAALSTFGFELRDRQPLGQQMREWLGSPNNREQIRKMMARMDENFRMNSGARS